MKTAVLSDIHGNLPALEAVLAEAASLRVDRVICLGDVVNYGPWSNECIDLLCATPGLILLEGNHEALFLGRENVKDEIALVQKFFEVTQPRFQRWEQIRSLAREVRLGKWLFTHTIGHLRIYRDTKIEVSENVFLGHTHHAFDEQKGGFRVVNPGSVGQNRRNLSVACFALLERDDETVDLRQVPYDPRPLLSEMRRMAYPQECLDYYVGKIR